MVFQKSNREHRGAILTRQSCSWLRTRSSKEKLWQQFASKCKRSGVEIGITRRQGRIRVVPRFVVIVFDVKILHFAVVYAQRTARVVDVLPIEILKFLKNKLIKFKILEIFSIECF